jgi:hypothetical protein
MFGSPNGGSIGGGFGGSFGNPTPDHRLGQSFGLNGGGVPQFAVDPMTAAYAQLSQQAQQAQFAPQGFYGNPNGQFGQQFGHAFGGAQGSGFGNPAWANSSGGSAGSIGRFLPYGVDPIAAAYAQQAQLAHLALQAQLQQAHLAHLAQLQQAQLQQAQLIQQLAQQQQAPFAAQGFGIPPGQFGQPFGGTQGSIFGNPAGFNPFGGVGGPFGRFMPFQAMPGQNPVQSALH